MPSRGGPCGNAFQCPYSLDAKAYNPARFFGTIEEAQVEADTIFGRLNTARGADVHARPDDMKKAQVWIERFSHSTWVVIAASVRNGHLDTARRS